jgi:hypothetical protein
MKAFRPASFFLVSLFAAWSASAKKPNIPFILADDMGYVDAQV